MEDKKMWKGLLADCARNMNADPVQRERALIRIAQEAEKKEIAYQPGGAELVRIQLLSVPVNVWVLQCLFLAAVFGAEFCLRDKINAPMEIFPLLSVCMALGALVLVQELSRHFSCKTAEIEQSCYLNLSQLWLMRAGCISGLDVLAAGALGLSCAGHYGVGWFSFSVYVLTPFFLANAGLLVFYTCWREKRPAGCAGICLLLAVCLYAAFFCGQIYEKVWFPVWLFLLAGAVLVSIAQMKTIGQKMEEEGLCWS